jgi:hypothetical protein
MTGIGGQEIEGKVVTVQAELPEDIDGILDAIRKIILMGEVQSLTLKSNEPITYRRLIRHGEEIRPEESTQSYAELTAYEIVRSIQMEEWDSYPEGVGSPHINLIQMFVDMATHGWAVTHLLVGENTEFWEWLGLPRKVDRDIKQFLGARIEKSNELPPEVYILCGSKTRNATIAEIGFALKGVTYEQRTDAKDN